MSDMILFLPYGKKSLTNSKQMLRIIIKMNKISNNNLDEIILMWWLLVLLIEDHYGEFRFKKGNNQIDFS